MRLRSDVLYVTYDGLLEPLGGSQVVPYVEGLSAAGYAITVLSFEKSNDLPRPERRRLAERLATAGVGWVPLRYHRRPSLAATGYDVAMGAGQAVAAARSSRRCRGSSPFLVHARSYVAGAIGLAAKRAVGARVLFDMRGHWVDERIESGIWTAGSAAVRVSRRAERALLRNSDAVVSLTSAGVPPLGDLSGGAGLPPIDVIPTCVDLARFKPAADPDAARRALGIPPGPVCIYAGSLSTWYLPAMIAAVGRAFARITGGTFVILTRETAAATAAVDSDPRVMVRSVSFSETPLWLAAADAGLAFVRVLPSKRASLPTKVGEYLASGLAVVATSQIGDLDAHFSGTRVAFTVTDSSDPEAVARQLADAARRPNRREEARGLATRHYSLSDGIAQYANIYERMGVRRRND